MRVLDLRSSPPAPAPPTVEVQASAGVELLRFLGVLTSADPAAFDIGAQRVADVRAALPPELLADLLAFVADPGTGGHGGDSDAKAFVLLSLLGAALPAPADVPALLAHLEADTTATWRMLLAHHVPDSEVLDDARRRQLADRLLLDDTDAVEEVRALADDDACNDVVRALLAQDPEAHQARVVDLVRRTDEAVWRDLEAEAMGPIERDVAHHRQRLDEGVPAAQVVLEATNGYELADDTSVSRVLLLPSYWFRPWLVVGHLGERTEVISTVVAEEFLALPPEAPPPSLLKLFKALSDEGRLTLVRHMAAGPISLTEAADALSVAKATAHHHLSILRQAGLVSMRGEGRSTRYALRTDPPVAARDALAAYVPPRRG